MPAPHVTVPCHFCQHPVYPGAVGTFERVTGWGELRGDGGMNAVRLAEHHHEFAHRTCIDRAKRGHRAGQIELMAAAALAAEPDDDSIDFPPYDGTQEGITPVTCPREGCDWYGIAKSAHEHIEAEHG